jgi:O-antigen/teichoic acid export membrane protein
MSDRTASAGSRLGQLAANAASLLTSDVLNKATTFAVYAMVPRYLGTRELGQLSLGLLLLYSFQVFATVGLPTMVTRDVTRRRRRTARYFTCGSVTVAATSAVATLSMILFAWLMRYDLDTFTVIALVSLGLLPYALTTVTEALFRAWERMQYIAYANVPVNVAKVVGAYLLLERGGGVVGVVLLLVICRAATLIIEWTLLFLCITRPSWQFSISLAKKLVRQSSTFLGIDGAIAIWFSIDAVLLSKLASEEQVGLFAGACQLFVPVFVFYQGIVSSVFPTMCRLGRDRREELSQLVRWLIGFLMTAGVPSAVGLFFLAKPILPLLYGEPEMASASGVVQILAVVLLFRSAIDAQGQALWAMARERITLAIVVINLVVNLVVGFVLIPQFGIIGAAVASLITWMVNAGLHWAAASWLLGSRLIDPAVWRVAVAGAVMAACFIVLDANHLVWTTALAVMAYLFVLSVLMIGPHGGLGQFRSVYFAPLLK